jgi:hypothetical protein
MTTQHPSVGSSPTVGELFVGALMFSTVNETRAVLLFVEDLDVDEPAATVLAAVRVLALRGTPPSPQLVRDELKRRGKLTKSTGLWLASATTSGACSSAASAYAGAVVAESFRANVEILGSALIDASTTSSEREVGQLVERAVARLRGIAARLAELRGGEL